MDNSPYAAWTVVQPCILCEQPLEEWSYVVGQAGDAPDVFVKAPPGGPHICEELAALVQERNKTGNWRRHWYEANSQKR